MHSDKCSGSFTANNEERKIDLPGWPSDYYGANTTCEWDIVAEDSKNVVQLKLDKTEMDKCCDYLEVSLHVKPRSYEF